MRRRLLAFVGSLRANGLAISVAETMDALAAVAEAGVEREVLRDALATTLVKDERDRPVFDPLFDAAFPLRRGPRPAPATRERGAGGGGAGGRAAGGTAQSAGGTSGASRDGGASEPASGVPGGGSGNAAPRARAAEAEPRERAGDVGVTPVTSSHDDAGTMPATPDAAERTSPGGRAAEEPTEHDGMPLDAATLARLRRGVGGGTRRARTQALLAQPFGDWTADDLVAARDVVAELARGLRLRLARRERTARRGRLDLRRTLRRAAATGGVPLALRHRTRRPRRPDLVVLCDVSGSVATASTLCLGLLAPATPHFRRVRLFAFVDHPCPVSVEDGHVVPDGPLDLWARSDMGQVLAELWRDEAASFGRTTVVLVVGDARNNRRPPRADVLRAIAERVQRIVWLVPEPRARWNTGDSVLGRYAASCDAVLECTDLAGLADAVRRVL